MKVVKNKALIDLEGYTVKVADEYQVTNGDNVAILKILKVGKNRALAEITKGKAKSGLRLAAVEVEEVESVPQGPKHSYDVSSGFQSAKGFSAGSLTVGYYRRVDEPGFTFSSVSLSTSSATTETLDSTDAELLIKTKTFDLDLGYAYSENLDIGFGITQLQTPETGYTSGGGSVTLKFFSRDDPNEKDFESSISLNVKLQGIKIYQQIVLPSNPSAKYIYPISQWSAGLSVGWRPVERYSFRFGTEQYFYDKSNSELQVLPRLNFISQRASSLVSTVAGLLRYNFSAGSQVYFGNASAGLTLDHSSVLIEDQAVNSLSYSLAYQFDMGLNLALGATNSITNDYQTWLYTAGLGYAF